MARTVAIIAVDVGSVAATVGCYGGAAALTVATAGAGAVAMVGCEVVTDIAVGIIADPSIIPDAKELVGVVKPPVDLSTKHWEVIMYGTVWDPKWRIGTP